MSGTTDELSKVPAASNNEEDLLSEMISQQKIEDLSNNENDEVALCANCGKEGNNLNICNKCKEATYCNAACKKKHRSKHKKQCERRVAELHDEALFNEPPPQFGDCPICFNVCQLWLVEEGTCHVAERLYVAGAPTLMCKIIMAT